MAISKKYFHDHLVLALLSANAFLAIAGSLYTLVKLSTTQGNGYFVQFRPSLGINAYKTGNIFDILSLMMFSGLVLAFALVLSLRIYKINRQSAITMLSLSSLLLIFSVIVEYQLLALR